MRISFDLFRQFTIILPPPKKKDSKRWKIDEIIYRFRPRFVEDTQNNNTGHDRQGNSQSGAQLIGTRVIGLVARLSVHTDRIRIFNLRFPHEIWRVRRRKIIVSRQRREMITRQQRAPTRSPRSCAVLILKQKQKKENLCSPCNFPAAAC